MNKPIIIFCLIFGILLALFNFNYFINSASNNTESVRIIIPKGYSVKKIAEVLSEKNIITHKNLFWIAHRFLFKNCSLQAGEYEIPPKSSIRTIIDFLHEGRVLIHKFTIPEGITMHEALNKILQDDSLTGEILKQYKEGDFLADTYNYTYGESKQNFAHRIYEISQSRIDALWEKRDLNTPLKSKEEAIILASIIDKETGVIDERKRVAGVFINRLIKGMRLQADPTVIYAITLGKISLGRPLTKSDLKINSPYNTYVRTGLPPTAICNPGQAALEAALHPLATKELYFVVDGKGGHNFAANLDDHNKNVKNYKKLKEDIKNVD